MSDEKQSSETPRTGPDVARARVSLFFIFGVGALGVAVAIAWVARNAPKGQLPSAFVAGSGAPGGDVRRPLPARCTKFGDSCEFSPGKLGTCIERENCAGEHCLFCQSQH